MAGPDGTSLGLGQHMGTLDKCRFGMVVVSRIFSGLFLIVMGGMKVEICDVFVMIITMWLSDLVGRDLEKFDVCKQLFLKTMYEGC